MQVGSNNAGFSFHSAEERHLRHLKLAAKDFGRLTEIVGVIFAQTGGNPKCRAFLDAILGIAKGRVDWDTGEVKVIKASLETLIKQIKEYDRTMDEITKESQRQRVRRMRDKFLKNQEEADVTWIEHKLGNFNKETGKNEKSEFKPLILGYALEAMHRAKTNPERYMGEGPGSEWERAAIEVANEILPQDNKRASRKRKRPIQHEFKQILGMLRSHRRRLQTELGYDDETTYGEMFNLFTKAMDEPEQPNVSFDTPPTKNHRGERREKGGITSETPSNNLLVSRSVLDMSQSKEDADDALAAAISMIEAFESVGCTSFNLSLIQLKEDDSGKLIRFSKRHRSELSLEEIRCDLPRTLDQARQNGWNVIIRPYMDKLSPMACLVQLDDLNEEQLQRVAELAFLVIETSQDNYQAWLAVDANENIKRRLKQVVGADCGASESVRIAGSLNAKPNRRLPDGSYPIVKLVHSELGLIVEQSQLERVGLLSESLPDAMDSGRSQMKTSESLVQHNSQANLVPRLSLRNQKILRFPNYLRCLNQAPPAQSHSGPDRSAADFAFSFISGDWGHSKEATILELLSVSEKAKERGREYAEITVEKAYEALANEIAAVCHPDVTAA